MKRSELEKILALTKVSGDDEDRDITGVYAGDLLSRAMGRVQSGDVWITIMNNRNVAAVASLTDAAAVILAEGVQLMPDAAEAAEDNGISVYSTEKTVYEICALLAESGL